MQRTFEDKLYDTTQVMAKTGLKRSTVRRWSQTGLMPPPFVDHPKSLYWKGNDLEAWWTKEAA